PAFSFSQPRRRVTSLEPSRNCGVVSANEMLRAISPPLKWGGGRTVEIVCRLKPNAERPYASCRSVSVSQSERPIGNVENNLHAESDDACTVIFSTGPIHPLSPLCVVGRAKPISEWVTPSEYRVVEKNLPQPWHLSRAFSAPPND